jgi:protein O-mannosyl-transferase
MRLRRDPDRSAPSPQRPAAGPSSSSATSGSRSPGTTGGLAALQPKPQSLQDTLFLQRILAWWQRGGLKVLFLAIATVFAYWPCLHGDFVWDDDAWTYKLQGLFQNSHGLPQIWTNLTALQQYYPLTATTFWIDYHLWGFWTLPYHLENLLLHLSGALLFARFLNRLQVPGAWLAAAVFALHPLMVESVAWITERKNVLSLVLYLGALLAYGRFTGFWRSEGPEVQRGGDAQRQRWRFYALALVLFLGAYLAKATAFSLPAALLLICWWKQGRLHPKTDILLTLPFWVVGVGLGLVTSWLERTHVGAIGPDWAIPFAERCLIAGRALWFYVGKLLWPVRLCFVYPRWQMDATSILQWLWPISAVLVVLALWSLRRWIGRGPVTALLFYAGTLFPLLGFFNGYFMRYSFVSDHWAYLPSLGLIALGCGAVARMAERFQARRFVYYCACVLPVFVILTRHQCGIFTDAETLYRATLARNPEADLAQNNLGMLLAQAGQMDEAVQHLQKAVAIRPGSARAHNNLANAMRVTGRPREAAEQYELSLKLEPGNANTWNNLALLLATSSDASVRNGPRAVQLAQQASNLTQDRNPVTLATLAAAYAESGRFGEAVSTVRKALDLAASRSQASLSQALQAQLELYQQGLPFRDAPADDPQPTSQPGR